MGPPMLMGVHSIWCLGNRRRAMRNFTDRDWRRTAALTLFAAAAVPVQAFAAWEPTKTVEFIVPAGTGGGADQMARVVQGIIAKNKLMKQPMVVINKAGGAGAEGFLDVKESKGDAHKIIITLSNLFTTPLATHTPFNWRDLTPVQMMALDNFVLWVNAETPYKTPKEYLAAVKAAGGEVAVQLVGKHVDSTVNNPIEAVAQWRAGSLRPLCVFDAKRMPYKTKITKTMSWYDIPTCKEMGLEVEYLMLRGIFMAGGVTPDQVQYYVDLLKKVRATPDWTSFLETGAFNQTTLSGKEYETWVAREEARHIMLMKEAGFLAR